MTFDQDTDVGETLSILLIFFFKFSVHLLIKLLLEMSNDNKWYIEGKYSENGYGYITPLSTILRGWNRNTPRIYPSSRFL